MFWPTDIFIVFWKPVEGGTVVVNVEVGVIVVVNVVDGVMVGGTVVIVLVEGHATKAAVSFIGPFITTLIVEPGP
jgi:hypothetical protein